MLPKSIKLQTGLSFSDLKAFIMPKLTPLAWCDETFCVYFLFQVCVTVHADTSEEGHAVLIYKKKNPPLILCHLLSRRDLHSARPLL